ncbi:RagB/SusD family nutrient uptake outer membrane protein [Pedobacter nutrimenti]|uniref:RagB/SusD family nutrient uptake outer membrane protein n=1 Tax=Pedobacter nutrimenti TaxID=1241337 RepID=UPI00292CE4FF|nr:RagB/SusD family nutrient uptake outer membrane protein [Pedobacter nutrimenti]
MKKLFNLFFVSQFAILLTISFGGCKKFIDPETPSIITDKFYNTKEGQEKLLVDIYAQYRGVFNTSELQYYGTDLYMAIGEGPVEKMFNGYDKTFNSTAPVVGGYWKNLYKIVQESNTLLSRCTPAIAGGDYNKITAQGRFLRVLAYYYLVETFGPVPFYDKEQTEVIETATRTPEQAIYTFMISELVAIKGQLPLTSTEAGRLNNAAVTHLLGKIYLTRAYKPFAQPTDFTNAASNLDEVISQGKSAFYLSKNYKDAYDETKQNNPEVIWAIQYGTDKNFNGSGNPQQSLFGFNITALEPGMFIRNQLDYSSMQRQYWVIPKAHELFTNPDIDTRYDATFKREFYVNNPANTNFGALGIYFPRWNDQSGISNGAQKFYPFKNGGNYNWYPQSTSLAILNDGIDRMPIVQKFKDTKMEWGGLGTREDVVFRLADTYLLAAEAYLGAGNQGLALERVNAIRQRAAKDDASYVQFMQLNSLNINVIMDERARELFGDHDRWFDLKRSHTLIERAKAYNPFVQQYNNINNNHLVRPIPQDELNKLSGIAQNNGY